MIYVALTLAVALVLTVAAFAGLVRSLIRQHARERGLLLNQLFHAVGKTWEMPPADNGAVDVVDDHERFVRSPEQEPDL